MTRGRPLSGLASCPPSRDRMGWGTRPYVVHHPSAFHGVLGWWADVSRPTHQSVADVSPRWGGRAGVVSLELRPSGARQRPDGADAPQYNQDHHVEREGIMTMRHAALRHANVAPRRPLKRSSEIILAAIIYLTASCFAVVGTLGFVAAIWVLWGAIGVR